MILDKSKLSEEDIKMKYITPAIQRAGWDIKKQVRAEYTFTDNNNSIWEKYKRAWNYF